MMTKAADISRLVSTLFDDLEKFEHHLHTEDNERDANEDVQKLLLLNRNLTALQQFMAETSQVINAAMTHKLQDIADPMDDYEMECVLHYTLRENDPEWSDDEDNFITTRTYDVKHESVLTEAEDWRNHMPGMALLNSEPHSWLFNDLHGHCYGMGMRNVSLGDCSRIGSVWLDLVVRQQYWMDLENGTWIRRDKP